MRNCIRVFLFLSQNKKMLHFFKIYEYKLEYGVRQGGLTSPILLSLHVNDLFVELIRKHVDCWIVNICINNLSYADDMVLLWTKIRSTYLKRKPSSMNANNCLNFQKAGCQCLYQPVPKYFYLNIFYCNIFNINIF